MYSPTTNMDDVAQTLRKDADDSTKKLRRLRTKMVLKTVVTTVVLIGSVTTSILLPNPISMAVAISCATMLSAGEGLKHTVQRIKAAKLRKKAAGISGKELDKQILVSRILSSVQNVGSGSPSAPPPQQQQSLYPNLSRGV